MSFNSLTFFIELVKCLVHRFVAWGNPKFWTSNDGIAGSGMFGHMLYCSCLFVDGGAHSYPTVSIGALQ